MHVGHLGESGFQRGVPQPRSQRVRRDPGLGAQSGKSLPRLVEFLAVAHGMLGAGRLSSFALTPARYNHSVVFAKMRVRNEAFEAENSGETLWGLLWVDYLKKVANSG